MEFVFNRFTLEDLEDEGYIKQGRRKYSKSEPVVLTSSMFRRGLFKIFKELNLFPDIDGDIITMTLEKFQAVVDAYSRLHDIRAKQDLYGVLSIITADMDYEIPLWEDVFIANISTEIDNRLIDLHYISSVKYDGGQNRLKISGVWGEQDITLLSISVTKPKRRKKTKLSLRVLSQPPMKEQLRQIEGILRHCDEIQKGTQKFIEILPKGISSLTEIQKDEEVLIAKSFSKVDFEEVFTSARDMFRALIEYARGFRIELVAV